MRRLRRGNVPCICRGEHQRVHELRGRPIPTGYGVDGLHWMRCGEISHNDRRQCFSRMFGLPWRILSHYDRGQCIDRVHRLCSRLLWNDHGLQCIDCVRGMSCGVLFVDDGRKRLDRVRWLRSRDVPHNNWCKRFCRMHGLCRR